MRGLGPKLHPGLALGPRGGSCSSDTGVSPSEGVPWWSVGWPHAQGQWQGQRWPWQQPASSSSREEAGGAGRSAAAPARLAPHFRGPGSCRAGDS